MKKLLLLCAIGLSGCAAEKTTTLSRTFPDVSRTFPDVIYTSYKGIDTTGRVYDLGTGIDASYRAEEAENYKAETVCMLRPWFSATYQVRPGACVNNRWIPGR